MTIEELAGDKTFDPDRTGLPVNPNSDPLPWRTRPPKPGSARRKIAAQITACMVCGVPYSAGNVCGYCRHAVRELRDAKLIADAAKGE